MLGDHGGNGKCKPWEASVSVPLLCFGGSDSIGIKQNAVVTKPVATMDLAGTFMDYAGATPVAGMTTKSLRPLLNGTDTIVRPFIASGLYSWRMVVQEHNQTQFKFVCCKGRCPNAPSNVGKPQSGWTQLLYDIENDQFDMHELSAQQPDVVRAMKELLPASFKCGGAP